MEPQNIDRFVAEHALKRKVRDAAGPHNEHKQEKLPTAIPAITPATRQA